VIPRIEFELVDDRDLTAWNATVLDVSDGGAFVSAVMDRDGRRFLALHVGATDLGTGIVAKLDPVDVLRLMDAIDTACQAHGGAPRRFSW
jgi:hypothetical protein